MLLVIWTEHLNNFALTHPQLTYGYLVGKDPDETVITQITMLFVCAFHNFLIDAKLDQVPSGACIPGNRATATF